MQVKTKLTAEEFFRIHPEESRIELIDGEVYEMPAPNVNHQRVLFYLSRSIHEHLSASKVKGEVFIAPVDVVFSEEIVLQPDIVYVSDLSKVKDRIYGVPDLVVEVASPSTLKRDITDKMKIYERYGVKEYWIVFSSEKTIVVYQLTENGYEPFSSAIEKGKVRSKVLEGFEINLEEVFGGL